MPRNGLLLALTCSLSLAGVALAAMPSGATEVRSRPTAVRAVLDRRRVREVVARRRGYDPVLYRPEYPTVCHVEGRLVNGAPPPMLVAVGASYTAGVGATTPEGGWAIRLAELLSWQAVTEGVPGAGYEHGGTDDLGPVERELSNLDLMDLDPSLVIIQAGHNDADVPAPLERRRVDDLLRYVETEAPEAQLVVLTVFGLPGRPSRKDLRVDTTIVKEARRADPSVIVMDPLRGHWHFQRDAPRGLHPSSLGAWDIARKVLSILVRDGVTAPPRRGPDVASADASCVAIGAPSIPRHRRPPVLRYGGAQLHQYIMR